MSENSNRISLREIDNKYPTIKPHKSSKKAQASARYKNKLLGKMGAASKVRTIDPSSLDLSKYLQSDGGK